MISGGILHTSHSFTRATFSVRSAEFIPQFVGPAQRPALRNEFRAPVVISELLCSHATALNLRNALA